MKVRSVWESRTEILQLTLITFLMTLKWGGRMSILATINTCLATWAKDSMSALEGIAVLEEC
jgi:hypothetical protein